MCPKNGVVLSLGVGLWAAFGSVGCTFPMVDYEDPKATTTEAAPCAVPQACATTMSNCATQAKAKSDSCMTKCSGGTQTPPCTKCQDAAASAIDTCMVGCEGCSANNGCENATDSCSAYFPP